MGTGILPSPEVWTRQARTHEAWPGAITGRPSAGTKTAGGELLRGVPAAPCLGEGLKDVIGAQQQRGCRNREVRWPPPCPLAGGKPQPAPTLHPVGTTRLLPAPKTFLQVRAVVQKNSFSLGNWFLFGFGLFCFLNGEISCCYLFFLP